MNFVRVWRRYTNKQSKQVSQSLRSSVKFLGEKTLGIKELAVDPYSVRSTFMTLLLIHNVEVAVIIKLGRWKRDVVIRYITENVADFSAGTTSAFRFHLNKTFFNYLSFA